MKSVSNFLQLQHENIYIESENGRWWSGSLKGVKFSSFHLGDISINFKPRLLLSGKLGFDLEAKNKEYEFIGLVSYSSSQNYWIEKAFLKIQLNKALANKIKYPFFLSNLSLDLPALSFNKSGCNSVNGKIVGNLLDTYGFINQKVNLKASIACSNRKLVSVFKSSPKEDLFFGKITINSNLDYYLEASSGKITSKIGRLAKLNFSSEPLIKISGNINDFLN